VTAIFASGNVTAKVAKAAVLYRYRSRHSLARPAGAFWRPDQDSHPIFALGEEWRMEEDAMIDSTIVRVLPPFVI
jgi:hypothetical protein